MSSRSSRFRSHEAFVRTMRDIGATRVTCGEVTVEFPEPPPPAGVPRLSDPTERAAAAEDEKRERERLVYGSSE